MTISSMSIHADKPLMLKYGYQGQHDTAVLSITDADYVHHEHATIFMDGVYAERLERAVEAFNSIMRAPDKAEAA
jgi:hypothetical protein